MSSQPVNNPAEDQSSGFLRVSDLARSYGSVKAVDGLDFAAYSGAVAIVGQNGAGKSTTLNMLAALIRPSRGAITGPAPWGSPAYRRQLGYLPERLPLYPDCTVRSQLRFAARLYKLIDASEAVGRVIDQCDLGALLKRRCGKLSKGLRQRVGLAQAIIHQPTIVLLDEPASGLDPVQQTELHQLIGQMARQALVVLSTHNLNEALTVADHVLVMHQGRQAWYGSNDALDKASLVDLMSGQTP